MNQPTLNAVYNSLLVKWAAAGHPTDPDCEECGCDLTGKQVVEVEKRTWTCEACAESIESDNACDEEHCDDRECERDYESFDDYSYTARDYDECY